MDIKFGSAQPAAAGQHAANPRKTGFIARVFGFLAGIVLGGIVSIVASFVQADEIYVSGHRLLIGIPLAISFVALTQLWLAQQIQTQLASIGVVIAWGTSTFVMSQATANGDFALLKGSTSAHYYLIVGAVVLGAIGTMRPLKRPVSTLPVGREENSINESESDK